LGNGERLHNAIAILPPMQNLELPESEGDFTLESLRSLLVASQCAAGWYSKRVWKGGPIGQDQGHPFAFCMILDGGYEPLPLRVPGQHSARISAFLQSLQDKPAECENLKYMALFIQRHDEG
jgi:hypothetical protein